MASTPLPSRFPGPTPSGALAISASAVRSGARQLQQQLLDERMWPAPLYYGSRSLRAVRRSWPVVWRLLALAGVLWGLLRWSQRRRARARQKTVERSYALFGNYVRFGLDMGGTLSKVVYFEPARTVTPAQAALRARVSAFIKRSNSYGVTGRRDPELELRCSAINGTLHFLQFQTAMMPNFVNIVREQRLSPQQLRGMEADASDEAGAAAAAGDKQKQGDEQQSSGDGSAASNGAAISRAHAPSISHSSIPHHVHHPAATMLPLHPSRLGRSYSAAWRSEEEFRQAQAEAASASAMATSSSSSNSSDNAEQPDNSLDSSAPKLQQAREALLNASVAAPSGSPSSASGEALSASVSSTATTEAHPSPASAHSSVPTTRSPSPAAVAAVAALNDPLEGASDSQPPPLASALDTSESAVGAAAATASSTGAPVTAAVTEPARRIRHVRSRSGTSSSSSLTPTSASAPSTPRRLHESYGGHSFQAAAEAFRDGLEVASHSVLPAVAASSGAHSIAAASRPATAAAPSSQSTAAASSKRSFWSRGCSTSPSPLSPQSALDHSLQEQLAPSVCATGGGAFKFEKLFREALHISLHKEDELSALVKGIDFCIHTCANECYTLSSFHFRSPRVQAEPFPAATIQYPYLVCNIGSGVSILKVTGPASHERVGGSSLGGGTFYGLCRALTGCTSFEEALALAERGRGGGADLLVGDIYGGAYTELGLPASTVAASFGKLVRGDALASVSKADLAKAALVMITNNIGSLANLYARKVAHATQVIFVGNFLHQNDIARRGLAFATDYWSKGQNKALFLAHEGYFGAVGAMLGGSN